MREFGKVNVKARVIPYLGGEIAQRNCWGVE